MATITRTTTERRARAGETPALDPRWHVVLLDDNDHTYDYVVYMLGSIFGYGREKAYALARIVDSEGRVIVATTSHERALTYQARIHAFGADPLITRSKGSMSAVIEAAE